MSFGIVNAIWRARQNALRTRESAQGVHGHRNYNPNQPRVPAGQPEGGRWTSAAHDAPHAEDVVVNEDGSIVRSEVNTSNPSAPWDERHTVRMPDGEEFIFENFGPTQTIFNSDGRPIEQNVLTKDGPEPQALVQSVRDVRPGGQGSGLGGLAVLGAAAALFTALSARNSREKTAILAYRASDYRTEEEPLPKAVWVGRLTEDDVRNTCKRYGDTKQIVNKAASYVLQADNYYDAADFGNKVHKEVELNINAKNNKNWLAEPSLEKLEAEDPRAAEEARLRRLNPNRGPPIQPPPGASGSIRVDVLDNQGNGTVCVYDVKTGGQHRLIPSRMAEIARGVYYHFPTTQRIIVAEIRPWR